MPTTSAAAGTAAAAAGAAAGYDAIGSAVEQFKASLEAEAAAAAEGVEDPAYESASEPPAKKMQIMISPGELRGLLMLPECLTMYCTHLTCVRVYPVKG